jgi:hypothetical protein
MSQQSWPDGDGPAESERLNEKQAAPASPVELEDPYVSLPRHRFPWGGLLSLGIAGIFIVALILPGIGRPHPRSQHAEQLRRQHLIDQAVGADAATLETSLAAPHVAVITTEG